MEGSGGFRKVKQETHPDIYAMMQHIKLDCAFKPLGCHAVPDLTSYTAHLAACSYDKKTVFCGNHAQSGQQCPFRSQDPRDLQEHLEYACRYMKLTCEHCLARVPRPNMEFHHRVECQAVPIKCIKKCGSLVPRKYIIDHLAEECS